MKKHNTTYNPANYEFSLYCTKCMCRISEDGPVGRCCLFPIKDKFIRKLYYKHNRHNRNDYYRAALAMGKREIAKDYPEVIPAEDLQLEVLKFIDNCLYSDYENVSINIATNVTVIEGLFQAGRNRTEKNSKIIVDLGVKYLKEIKDGGWRPFYMASYHGSLTIIDNTLHFNPCLVKLFVNHSKLKSAFIEAVTKYDKEGRFDGFHILPLELWENVFQYYVLHAYLHGDGGESIEIENLRFSSRL